VLEDNNLNHVQDGKEILEGECGVTINKSSSSSALNNHPPPPAPIFHFNYYMNTK
jgi:hypothetical protein